MDPIYEAVTWRRSIRKYQEKQVPDELLQRIIEVGRYAPSAGNAQTTRLLVIQNKDVLEELKTLVQSEFAVMEYDPQTMFISIKYSIAAAKQGTFDFFYSAPTFIVVSNKKGYPNAMADSSCVLENMMVEASYLKIGSCWINQLHWLDDHAAIHKKLVELGMGDDETVCGGLALGYSALPHQSPLERSGNPVVFVK